MDRQYFNAAPPTGERHTLHARVATCIMLAAISLAGSSAPQERTASDMCATAADNPSLPQVPLGYNSSPSRTDVACPPAPKQSAPNRISQHNPASILLPRLPRTLPPNERTVLQLTTEQSKIVDSLPLPDGKKEFLSKVALAVMQADPEMHGINPRVMLAQAILETGWGSSSLAWRYNNLFGMKYWGEGKATPPIRTSEYAGRGDPYTINARFRAFDSLLESVQAYIADISSDPWYKDATRYPHDDSKYLNGLLNGKMAYATTPTYKSMILNIIEKFHLRQLTRLPT